MATNIKILKDTPFDKAGDVISISAFRAKYGYTCSTTTSDKDLVAYIEGEWKLN